MQNIILGMLAETFIHSGSGRTEGAIDLPVAREAATDFPYIPGSSLKGALRDYSRQYWSNGDRDNIDRCFGDEGKEKAGALLISDARLLLLPVRSLTGSYKWVTSRLILERLKRDLERSQSPDVVPDVPAPPSGCYIGLNEGTIYLEERIFNYQEKLPENLAARLQQFIHHQQTRERLENQLIILNDKDFSWFARYALSVQARNELDSNKKSNNLWYEETLPPDTVMYCVIGERCRNSGMEELRVLLAKSPYLQTGGNETIGQGWFVLQEFVTHKEEKGHER